MNTLRLGRGVNTIGLKTPYSSILEIWRAVITSILSVKRSTTKILVR